jgi:hypothetical protein
MQARMESGCAALRGSVEAGERCALEALTIADCHAVDMTRGLLSASGLQDFAWISQLR